MEIHSNVNQKILGDFVGREVKACVSSMISRLQELDDQWFDSWDIANLYQYVCENCGNKVVEETSADGTRSWYQCESGDYKTEEDPESEPQEIYEYWIVTDWLADKLEAQGEVIIREFGNSIWGRGCTGQAILLDGVIGNIAKDLEILDGQKYAWNK